MGHDTPSESLLAVAVITMTHNTYLEDRVIQLPFADGEHNVRLWEAANPRVVIVAIHGEHSRGHRKYLLFISDGSASTATALKKSHPG